MILGKEFRFNEEYYKFSIYPKSKNRVLLNEFLLSKFLSCSSYDQRINKLKNLSYKEADNYFIKLLKDLCLLEYRLKQKKDKSFKFQFMNIFYNGYNDTNCNYEKRFINYQLFAKFKEELKNTEKGNSY